MKAVVDDKIPFIKGVLEPFFEVKYLPGKEIRREDVLDADALIVRTRTKCDATLLENTPVQFIGTATIGFDHIDTHWCAQQGIRWENAPGCNSGSVAQYITAALFELARQKGFDLKDKILGIIGVGHVGRKVEHLARAIGMRVLLNDPPRARSEGEEKFTGLEELLNRSDIVTLHVPLNREGRDRTLNLVNEEFLKKLKPGAILINSSRGEVVNEQDLINRIRKSSETGDKTSPDIVLDVWQNEPDINLELLSLALIATPHIAGYSRDGKLNGTRMVVEKLADHFGLDRNKLQVAGLQLQADRYLLPGSQIEKGLGTVIKATYDIMADDRRLRKSPGTFEEQRGNYPVRREFGAYRIDPEYQGELKNKLLEMGFERAEKRV